MKRVDRLLIKARREIAGTDKRLILAFINYDARTGRYTAIGQLWDGITGHDTVTHTTEHSGIIGALHALETLAEQYPNSEDVPIIIDDIPAA